MSSNGWSEYQRLVLHQLEDNDKRLREIEHSLSKLSSVAAKHSERLAATAGVFGFFAGLVPVILVLVFGL